MLRKYKNKNGKRNPKTDIIGKKVRKINNKKSKLEKLQEVLEKNLQETDM
jgi:hypothetical protein